MRDIIYDIFIRGVIPLGVVAFLGYLSKKLIFHQKERIWYHLSALAVIIAAVILSYYSYQYAVKPYVTACVPENSILIGANANSDLNKSYWLVNPGEIISLPIPVKKNRLISLYITFNNYPIEIEYKSDKGLHKIKLNNAKSKILDGINVNSFSKGVTLSKPFGKLEEQILPFKFRTTKKAKIYSFEISRNYTSLKNNLFATMQVLFVAFCSISVIVWIYRLKIDKKPNQANTADAKSRAAD